MAITTNKLILGKDKNGYVTYGIPWTSTGVIVNLTANVAQSTTVPLNVDTALFSYSSGSNVIVSPDNTALIPSAVFASTHSDLNPVMRSVKPGQVLSFISPTTAYVKVSYYAVENIGGL